MGPPRIHELPGDVSTLPCLLHYDTVRSSIIVGVPLFLCFVVKFSLDTAAVQLRKSLEFSWCGDLALHILVVLYISVVLYLGRYVRIALVFVFSILRSPVTGYKL